MIPQSVQSISFRVYDEEEEYEGFVTCDNNEAIIPLLSEEYKIDCMDDHNRLYTGTYFTYKYIYKQVNDTFLIY